MESTRNILRDYGGTVLIAAFVALVIRFFVIEAYRIPTPAMRPALEPGDTIFVQKWGYGARLPGRDKPVSVSRLPARGDVVIFADPLAALELKRDYIKRVVGLPGDVVEVRKGWLTLNGQPLRSALENRGSCGTEALPGHEPIQVCLEPPILEDFGPERIPDGSVFVLGDLRTQKTSGAPLTAAEAKHQRSWGVIPLSAIKGKALWIWLSVDPRPVESSAGWFPHFRFDRMFRRID